MGLVFALSTLVMAGLMGGAWWLAARPTVLRVAVAQEGDDLQLLGAVAQILRREKAPVRLKLLPRAQLQDVATALENGAAELAVVRSDVGLPASGETVAVLHRNVAVLVARPGSQIASIGDLAGHRVGIVRGLPANERLLDAILAQYEVQGHLVGRQTLAVAEVAEAVERGSVDAVLVVGPITGDVVAQTVRAVATGGNGVPVFVPVQDAEAMALRQPALEAFEIVRGAFGGTPPKPAEAVQTISVTFRLMAHSSLDSPVVSELTRRLFQMRTDLAKAVPAADRIETPDTEKGARLPVHPGAADYFEDEELTFMERYGDWFYIAAMLVGFGASAVAAIAARMRARINAHAGRIEHLLTVVRRARDATAVGELDALEREADDVFAETLASSTDNADAARLTALSLALEHARHAISERRRQLKTSGLQVG